MTDAELYALEQSLTVEEKVGQLIQLSGEFFADDDVLRVGPQEKLGIDPTMIDMVGSVLNVCGAERVRQVQDAYLARSRHKIPLLFMADVEYGYRTAFPVPLGLGATWDPELVRRCAEVSAAESRVAGVHVTFAPMVDLVRDARWGRCLESTGEDVLLNCRYAEALVRGFQGDALGPDAGVAACVKHFAAYGAVEAGREYNTVDISERALREKYLPSYKAAVDAGAAMVMTSFNTYDGAPATANAHLMRDILRGEWGFDGPLITDYAAVHELVAHGVAADDREAALMAMNNGVDIDMKTACYANHLAALVRAGLVRSERLDEAVMRVLRLKNELGLFEDPYRGAAACAEAGARAFCTPRAREVARGAAEQAVVLLKNEGGLLPLGGAGDVAAGARTEGADHATGADRAAGTGTIAVVGPYARSRELVGLWAVHADLDQVVTLEQAFGEVFGSERVVAATGCEYIEDTSHLGFFGHSDPQSHEDRDPGELWEEALSAARGADVVVMALGEHPMESGEGGSKTDISLPARQKELLRLVRAMGKPVVLLVFAGRAVALSDVEGLADAILMCWYPGTEGSRAIARVLAGQVNPSGRLTMTFPQVSGQCPIYYDAFSTGRPERGSTHTNRFTSRYVDCPTPPLYPFGYGLSYHTAAYGRPRLSGAVLEQGGALELALDVSNTGARAGVETVQLYLRDVVGSVVRPVAELKAFEKVELEPGQTATVRFRITEEMLRFWRGDMTFGSEPGALEALVGPNSRDVQAVRFELK